MNMSIEEVITELSMMYSFKMHLILEGDDDRKFFQSSIRGIEHINFLCAWGSDNVSELILRLDFIRNQSGFLPTLGIIDRDYRIPLNTLPHSPNLLYTDKRDIECMMFDSPSFDSVLMEFGSKQKIQKAGNSQQIASLILNAASEIGALRYFSQSEKLGVSFQKLDIERLINKKTLAINSGDVVSHLNSRQGVTGNTIAPNSIGAAKTACNNALCSKGNPYFQHSMMLCRGHDLMEILAIGFRSFIGSRSATESCREHVESLFRLSYVAHFRMTGLAQAIEKWLTNNGLHPAVSLI